MSEGALDMAIGDCRAQVTAEFQRYESCFPDTESDLATALEVCDELAAQGFQTAQSETFTHAVNDCTAALECDQLGDSGDHCFPVALEHEAQGLLPEALINACIVSTDVDVCSSAVAQATALELEISVATRCLQAWAGCADELINSEPYWTENHCTTIVALRPDARAQAEPCLELACDEVAGCLVDAGAFNF